MTWKSNSSLPISYFSFDSISLTFSLTNLISELHCLKIKNKILDSSVIKFFKITFCDNLSNYFYFQWFTWFKFNILFYFAVKLFAWDFITFTRLTSHNFDKKGQDTGFFCHCFGIENHLRCLKGHNVTIKLWNVQLNPELLF